MTRTLIRPWTSPDPDRVPLCDDCRAGVRHAFIVLFKPNAGPAWEQTFNAIGPLEVQFLAEEALRDDPFDASIRIRHAPEPEAEAEAPDPIDEWKALRDAGLAESDLRYLDGDR